MTNGSLEVRQLLKRWTEIAAKIENADDVSAWPTGLAATTRSWNSRHDRNASRWKTT